MSSTARVTKELLTCPACKKPVIGVLALGFETGDVHGEVIDVEAKITGMCVSHDCVPKATRGAARAITAPLTA